MAAGRHARFFRKTDVNGSAITVRFTGALLVLPAILLLMLLYVLPMLGLGRMAFNETGPTGAMVPALSLATIGALLDDSFTLETTWNSLWLSFMATTLALVLAYPLALFLHRTTSRYKALLTVLAVMPMLVSGVVRVFGWLALLGDRGLVNATLMGLGVTGAPVRLVYNYFGVTLGLAESLMPYMILALLAGFGRLDRACEEAAASLGARPWRVFWRVTLPLSLPAVVLGYLLCFVLAMSAYITPKLLGGGRVFLLATEIFDQAITNVNWPAAAALALYTLVLVMLCVAAYAGLTRRFEA
jgi:putative spermidine/putrescine transport system permease protein